MGLQVALMGRVIGTNLVVASVLSRLACCLLVMANVMLDWLRVCIS
jgi:hypothetical protein